MTEETASDVIPAAGPTEEQARMIAEFQETYPEVGFTPRQRPEPRWEAFWLDPEQKARSLEGVNLEALMGRVRGELGEREPT